VRIPCGRCALCEQLQSAVVQTKVVTVVLFYSTCINCTAVAFAAVLSMISVMSVETAAPKTVDRVSVCLPSCIF
jgi:hypothetical protein